MLSASLGLGPAPARALTTETRLTVSVVSTTLSNYRPDLTLAGVVEASTVTNIVPQVSSKVIQLPSKFRPGAIVIKGELLFAIEPSDYELARQRTLARLLPPTLMLREGSIQAPIDHSSNRSDLPGTTQLRH